MIGAALVTIGQFNGSQNPYRDTFYEVVLLSNIVPNEHIYNTLEEYGDEGRLLRLLRRPKVLAGRAVKRMAEVLHGHVESEPDGNVRLRSHNHGPCSAHPSTPHCTDYSHDQNNNFNNLKVRSRQRAENQALSSAALHFGPSRPSRQVEHRRQPRQGLQQQAEQ